MAATVIERNRRENIDLVQIEYLSDLPISNKEIIVIEPNNPIAITLRKFLINLGFTEIYVCKNPKEGIEIFADLISNDINAPVLIDNEANKNIKSVIKEILEIQPNGKVIVITTKEKSDPQILKLFDMGISSIVQKPLVFDNVKKIISHLGNEITKEKEEEKQNESNEQDVKNKKLEVILSSKLVSKNKSKDILKINQSEAESLIKNAIEEKKLVEDKEVLEAACNQCGSTNITYSSECPNCHGINFQQKSLIEHYSCGKIYPKEEVNNTICPKCNKNLGSAGIDFREISELFVCSSCNDRFPKPITNFICFECGNIFIDKLAIWKKSQIYKTQK